MTSKAPQNIEKETRVERVRGPQVASSSELRIVEWQNEWIVKSAFPYAYQAPDDMLAQLRQRYRLDEVIQPGRTEFEQMLLLREWVRNRWNHGWTSTPQARNALEILEAAEQGSDFSCGYYSITIMQCLLALGFVARRFGISKTATEWVADDEGNIGHSITEAWSHQFHKWVMLDPDMNVHYERDGIPLSILEIHDAWVGRRWNEVRMIQGPTPFRMTDKKSSGLLKVWDTLDEHESSVWTFARHDVGDYYAHVNMYLANTHHSNEDAPPMLKWVDQWTPPKIIESNQPSTGGWTGNVHDMYPTVDQVQINLRADQAAWEQGEAALDVSLTHSMPNLDKLLVRLDHEAWRETGPDFSWSLRPGKNEIMAKAVNAFGREGHISRILLRYQL